MSEKYFIGNERRESFPPNYRSWFIINQDGNTVAEIRGPMSATIALAAVEKLNSDFDHSRWAFRMTENFERKNDHELFPTHRAGHGTGCTVYWHRDDFNYLQGVGTGSTCLL